MVPEPREGASTEPRDGADDASLSQSELAARPLRYEYAIVASYGTRDARVRELIFLVQFFDRHDTVPSITWRASHHPAVSSPSPPDVTQPSRLSKTNFTTRAAAAFGC